MLKQFMRFLSVGVIATAIHYAVLIALKESGLLSPTSASAVGFVISAVGNYLMNYHFTFRSGRKHTEALPRFASVALAGLALNALTMETLSAKMGLHYLLAQVVATGLVLVWNFAANRWWTFRATHQDS